MKKVFLTLTMLLFAFFGTMKAGVVVEIGAGTTTTTSYYPTYAYYNYSIAQEIFTGSEIGLTGEINKFGFNVKANSATRNLKIFMKEVSYDEFASTSAWETFTASEVLFDGSVDIAPGWVDVVLDTPFNYEGGNLLVCVVDETGGYVSPAPTYYSWNQNTVYCRLHKYSDDGVFDYTNPGVTGSRSKWKNNVRFDITPILGPAEIVATPNAIDLGYRPLGAWMAPATISLSNTGNDATVSAITTENDYFVTDVEVPFTLSFFDEEPFTFEVSTGTADEGAQNGNIVVVYTEDRSATLIPISAYAYTPVDGDVFENAIAVTTFPYNDNAPAGIYHNYEILGGSADGNDAVYEVTFDNDVLFSASTTGANGAAALYAQDFQGEEGPMIDNYYSGPEIGPGPGQMWFTYDYTGTNTFFGTSAGGGMIFGYKISPEILQEYGLGTYSIFTIESAAREGSFYDVVLLKGGDTPDLDNMVYYQEFDEYEPLYFFDVNLDEPQALGDDENIWVMFYSDSPYAAYCGQQPVDVVNSQIWYTTDLSSWYSNTTYTPVIYVRFIELPTGREVTLNLADLTFRTKNGSEGELSEADGTVKGTPRAQQAQNNRGNRDSEIDQQFVEAGTYYVVVSSTDDNFPVEMMTEEVPVPEPVYVYTPYDTQTGVEAPYLVEYLLGNYTAEMQVLFGSVYPPTTPLIDWTSDLVESFFLTELEHNKTYFIQINERNAAGTTEGDIIGFTTVIDDVDGFTADRTEIFNDETVTFTWTANRSLQGYNIYRDGVKVNETPITGTSFTDGPLDYNMLGYEYQIAAAYDEGESTMSDPITVYVSGYGEVSGHAWEIDSITPIYNASIVLQGLNEFGEEETITLEENTNPSGAFSGQVHAGTYTAIGLKDGYMDNPTPEFDVVYDLSTDDINVIMLEATNPLGMITATEEENDVLVEWSWNPASLIVDFETGDFSQAEFTLPATYPWAITNSQAHEGTYAMKSTCEGVASGSSIIEATVDVPYDGKMSFYVKVSTESNYDKFFFYIDGVQQGAALSGVADWALKEFDVTEGTHTYKWEYTKDSSVNSNDDCVYVDDITMYRYEEPLPPLVGATAYNFDDGLQGWTSLDANNDGLGWVLGSEIGGVYLVSGASLAGSGHNSSNDMVCSGSYSNATSQAITPDNYLVSPTQISVSNGAQINFWACAQDASYAAEHFGVAVSTTTATASAFTTIQEWTMTAKGVQGRTAESEFDVRGTREQGAWYQYSVDLSSYAGQDIWVAIRHFNCNDQFILNVDDITLADGSAKRIEDNRQLMGYNLYRRNLYGAGDTVQIATPAIDVMSYIDNEWPNLPFGVYSWGIQAKYEGNHHYAEKGRATQVIDFETGDLSQFEFVNTSAYPWAIATGGATGSSYCIKSSNGGVASSTSAISATVTYSADGTVSFDANCQGEGTSTFWDHCDFAIDGTVMLNCGANITGWNNYSYPVTAGEHTFTWSYTKDGSVNPTGDCMMVDNITFDGVAGGGGAAGNGGLSDILWSNEIEKDMEAEVTFNIALNNDQDPAGATIEMVGPEETYNGTFEEATLVFDAVRKGTYTVSVELAGYESVSTELEITADAAYDIFLEEVLEVVDNLYVSPTGWAVWESSNATSGTTAGSGSSIGGSTGGGGGGGGTGSGDTFSFDFASDFAGWTSIDVDGDGLNWVHSSNSTTASGYDYTGLGHTGDCFVYSQSFIDYDGSYDPDNYLISPAQYNIVAGSTLTFWADYANDSYPDHFGVAVATTASPTASDFTMVWEGSAKNGNGNKAAVRHNDSRYENWREHSIDLSAYAGQSVWIAFRHFNSYDNYEIWIDDVELTAGSKGDRYAVRYKVELDGVYEGETPNMFWQHDVTGFEEGETHVTRVAPVYATGMGDWVEYTWTYQDCSNFVGATNVTATENEPGTAVEISWTMPEGGVTPPPIGGATTFTEGFESGMPEGWTVQDGNNDGWTWCLTSDIPTTWTYYASLTLDWYRTGTNAICSGSYINGVGALTPNEYLVTDQVTLVPGSTFSFWAAACDASYPADHFGVFISDDATNWTSVQEWTLTGKGGNDGGRASRDGNGAKLGTWYNYSVDLSAYAGQKYIAIRHFNCSDQYIMVVDDIELAAPGKGNRAAWDLVASFTGSSAGQQAVATDGNFIYTASWQATPTGGHTFYKYDLEGNFVEGFDIAGATGIRDLTTDGEYFYGTSGGAQIFCMDFTNKTLVSTINCSGLTSRHITYDPERDGFWSGNWTTLALYDRTGALVQNGPATTSAYGSAYYKDQDDVEHVYLFCQTSPDGATNRVEVIDYNINTNTLNSTPVKALTDIPGYDPANGIAGGCFIGNYNDKLCFFGNVQQSPNLIGIYELEAGVTPPTPVEGIMGSVLLRDGEVIALFLGDEAGTNSYVDEGMEIGEHEYCVRVIYGGEPDVTLWAMSCPECATVNYTSIVENDVVDNLYPNPTYGMVTIEAQGMNHITVVNTLGQVVYDADVNADMMQLNLGQYKAGLYLIRVNTENGVSVKRVTVVK